MHGKDILNHDLVDIELSSWKRKWLEFDEKLRPNKTASLLKKCSENMYSDLSSLLKLSATLPACECERTFSVLRRLQTMLKASMTTKRLSSLAIINIHRGVQTDYRRAVKIFLDFPPTKVKRFKFNI